MRWAMLAAAVGGGSAVAIGAWAAHAGPQALNPQALAWLDTAVSYQMWHALALLGAAALARIAPGRTLSLAAAAFGLGIVLFCGSLYLLALANLPLAWLTPLGGLCFIAGWGLLAWHGWSAGARGAGDPPPKNRTTTP